MGRSCGRGCDPWTKPPQLRAAEDGLPRPPHEQRERPPGSGAGQGLALQAQVPIVLAYMDYARKVSGLGPVFVPTGDVEKDMAEIKRFYAGIKGRNAAQFDAE